MALNFPSDTTQPYIDPVSGLKYLYNGEVGGWETAIQPPCIISTTPPVIDIPGFLWWDSIDGNLYVLYKDDDSQQWVECSPSALAVNTVAGPIPNSLAVQGDLWFNTTNKRLHILNEGVWVDMMEDVLEHYQVTKPNNRNVAFTHFSPKNPSRGDLWYNRNDNKLHIYSDVEGYEGWKAVKGDNPDAPTTTTINQSVSVESATSMVEGTVRFATQAEVNSGKGTRTAISPGTLKAAISNYVTERESATVEEVLAGSIDTKVVTPKSLNGLLDVPVGTIITHLSSNNINGYLLCDGRLLNREDYISLFNQIGTTYGGDGVTFRLPNITNPPYHTFVKV